MKDTAERMTRSTLLPFARRIVGAVGFALPLGAALADTPCAGVDRRLPGTEKPTLERVIAAEIELPRVELLQSYRHQGWHILYVINFRSDDTFLFYHRDPPRGRILARWAGAAAKDEGSAIRRWVQRNVPGIPSRLASCFAWHVTRDRDL